MTDSCTVWEPAGFLSPSGARKEVRLADHTPKCCNGKEKMNSQICPTVTMQCGKTSRTINNIKREIDCYCVIAEKGLTLVQALRSRVGAKGCWRHFFKNPTTQLRVDWVLTEKKCEQTPKFACFSVQRRPLHLSQAEMLPSHAVLKEGIK